MTLLEQGGQPTTIDEYTEWNERELSRQAVSRRSVLKAVMAGAGGYAAAQFGLANAAFAAGGGTIGTSGTAISGRHLSFVQGRGGRPDNAMQGKHTTFTIRTLADALPGTNEPYSEIDRITLQRRAGEGRIRRVADAPGSDPGTAPGPAPSPSPTA